MTNDETNRAAAVAGASLPEEAADIRNRWGWAEPSLWTDRLRSRLEGSEPTTQGFVLWDPVRSERSLQAAFGPVWRNEDAPESAAQPSHSSASHGSGTWLGGAIH